MVFLHSPRRIPLSGVLFACLPIHSARAISSRIMFANGLAWPSGTPHVAVSSHWASWCGQRNSPPEIVKARGRRSAAAPTGGFMDGRMGALRIQYAGNAVGGQIEYQIAWTHEQLQQIEQALEEGDEAFLATVEAAIRLALDTVLKPRPDRDFHGTNG